MQIRGPLSATQHGAYLPPPHMSPRTVVAAFAFKELSFWIVQRPLPIRHRHFFNDHALPSRIFANSTVPRLVRALSSGERSPVVFLMVGVMTSQYNYADFWQLLFALTKISTGLRWIRTASNEDCYISRNPENSYLSSLAIF
jgi:hypothetical protein